MAEDLKITVNGQERNPRCEALLHDNGKPWTFEVPVCMGGTAIVGCNNDSCDALLAKRHDDPHTADVIFRDDSGRVTSANTVKLAPQRDLGLAV